LDQKKKELEEMIKNYPENKLKYVAAEKILGKNIKDKYDKLNEAIELIERRYDLCMLSLDRNSDFVIRKVKSEDLNQVRKIYSKVWIDENTGKTQDEEVRYFSNKVSESINKTEGDEQYLVLEKDNEILGIIGFRKPHSKFGPFIKTSKPIELYALYVLNKKRGVGSALTNKLIEIGKNNRYTEIVIFSASRWKNSWSFY